MPTVGQLAHTREGGTEAGIVHGRLLLLDGNPSQRRIEDSCTSCNSKVARVRPAVPRLRGEALALRLLPFVELLPVTGEAVPVAGPEQRLPRVAVLVLSWAELAKHIFRVKHWRIRV